MLKSVAPLALGLALIAGAPVTASAQDNVMELVRSDLRTQARALVTEAMALPDSQAQKFWPIYGEYERERALWTDRRMALIKNYAAQFETLTEQQAKTLADDWFDLQEGRLDLWEKYYKRVAKALSPSIAARFIQVENQVNLIMDVQVASEIPLVFKRGN